MPSRTRIKICGLTRESDVDTAVDAGADAVGFVNASPAVIAEAVQAIPQLVLQFHGDETPSDCAVARRPYLRAARMAPGFDLLDFAARYPDAQALLLDAYVEGYGGGGKVFDWSLIPTDVSRPVVLSGGLHAGNVVEGILRVRPWAVDVSSGVEAVKGVKDPAAVRRFCEAVREADARMASSEA
jgi:phosphoribosylanthranilate isomerase